MRKPPTKKQLETACAKWNAEYGEYTPVEYWTGVRDGPGKRGFTNTPAIVLAGHTAGVYMGLAGFVALSHVEADPEAIAAIKYLRESGYTPEYVRLAMLTMEAIGS